MAEMYDELAIIIEHPTGDRYSEVEVTPDIRVGDLVQEFVRAAALGEVEQGGTRKSFRLVVYDNGNERELSDDETLEDAGISNNARLRLYAKMRAGSPYK